MARRKTLPGEPIRSMTRFVVDLEEGRGVYFRHKYTSPGWAQNWSFHFVRWAIWNRYLFEAVPTRQA